MKSTVKRLFLLTGFALATLVLMSYCQTIFYHIFPSTDQRYMSLMDVLDGTEENMLIFGDSRSVMGIDSNIIKSHLNKKTEIYNLSSLSQDIYLSSYFYGSIESNTKLVIQCTSPAFFDKPREHSIPTTKAIPMFLSGYRMNENSRELIGDCNDFFEQPEFESYFEAREYFKNYITSSIRPIFDNEVYNEDAALDVHFPHMYTSDKSPNYPVQKTGCEKYDPEQKPAPQLEFLKKTNKYFNDRNIEYLIVLMPINPDDCNFHSKNSLELAEMITKETGIKVINLTDLLESEYFYDAVHANKAGAKIISREIAGRISKENSVIACN